MSESSAREIGLSWAALGFTFTLFLLLGALLSWLGGQTRLVLSLALGLAAFLGAALLASLIATALARMLRWNIYDHAPLYIGLNLLASGSLTVVWVVHAVRLVDRATLQAAGWQGGLLFFVGLLATVVAVQMIQEFFQGEIYRLANAALGFVGYLAWGGWEVWGEGTLR